MVKGKRAEKAPTAPNDEKPPAPSGVNSRPNELTPDENFVLTTGWKKKICAKRATIAEKQKDLNSERSDLRDIYKKCKAELGEDGLEKAKLLVELEMDENAGARMKAEAERLVWAAQWANAFDGQQLELMSDLRPVDQRAFEDGRRAGLAGDAFNCRYGQGTEAYHRFQDGWQAGQEIHARGFKPLEQPPADLGPPAAKPTEEPAEDGAKDDAPPTAH